MPHDALTAEALAAPPVERPDGDAVAWWPGTPRPGVEPDAGDALLPSWYMPAPAGTVVLRGWRRLVGFAIIAAFLGISAAGLCNTYGDILG